MNQTKDIIAFDPELTPGAYNAINVCLRLRPEERITIITDRACLEIAASLQYEATKVGSPSATFVLEDLVRRPTATMPQAILDSLENSQVSIFACMTQTGELPSRRQMTEVVNRNRIRHGHMVNIDKQIMMEGMRADYLAVDELSERLVQIARKAKTCRAVGKGGTNVLAEFDPELKWLKTSGIISPEKWGNLPGGEIFTAPKVVNGHFVVDGVVGDYLCQTYGDIQATPLTMDIVDSRITNLACDNKQLLDEFDRYVHTDENSDRAGEFAIGTNIAVTQVCGNILQDEKLPGLHIAFGHPYSEHTGANWTSTTHIDCVARDFDIWLDEIKVMEGGRFLI